jgi:hypothetical protein
VLLDASSSGEYHPLGDDLLSQYVTALQNRLGVRINQTTLRNAIGGSES